jgi:hypothetical protein
VTDHCIITHGLGKLEERLSLYIWPLDGPDIILGLPWLVHHNPAIDWVKGTLSLEGEIVSTLHRDQTNTIPAPELLSNTANCTSSSINVALVGITNFMFVTR